MVLSFLLQFWKPIAIGIAVLVFMGTLAWMKHSYDERRRDEGREEIQIKWDEDKAARIKRTTEITLEMYSQVKRAEDATIARTIDTSKRFDNVKAGILRIPSSSGVHFSSVSGGLFNDTSSAANSQRSDTGAKTRTNTVPETSGPEVVYDEREFVIWIEKAGEAYADAYNLWKFCREREDAYLGAMFKGVNP